MSVYCQDCKWCRPNQFHPFPLSLFMRPSYDYAKCAQPSVVQQMFPPERQRQFVERRPDPKPFTLLAYCADINRHGDCALFEATPERVR